MSSEMRPLVIVAACIVSKGHVLITKRKSRLSRGEWELPGGKVNLGEKLEDALCREIWEELHWNVTPVDLAHAQVNTYDDNGDDCLVLYYRCLPAYGCEYPYKPGSLSVSLWIGHTSVLRDLFCLPGTVEAIKKVLGEFGDKLKGEIR
jgi:8-oxo-dGTP pyrophosphatase MutT (NUDIX family)